MKASRLLQRLDSQMAAATTELAVDCKRAERAAYWARVGWFDESEAEIANLKSRYDSQPQAAMSVWLHFAEGITALSKHLDISARDKLLRACLLSRSAQLFELNAMAAGWLAHVEYVQQNFESMAQFVAESVRCSASVNQPTQAQTCLVIAQALHFAGQQAAADDWYRRAYAACLEQGDDAMLSAYMHNKASLTAHLLKLSDIEATEAASVATAESRQSAHMLSLADSSANYDRLIGVKNFGDLVPMLRATILNHFGRFGEAIEIYDRHLEASFAGHLKPWGHDILADAVWCAMNVGRIDWAIAKIQAIEESADLRDMFSDRRAVTYGRLSQAYRSRGETQKGDACHALALADLEHFRARQANWSALLAQSFPSA